MKAKRFANSRGAASFGTIVWILLLATSVYGASKFAPPYVSYYMLKTDVENEAKVAHMYMDQSIASRLLKKAVSWSVPIVQEDIEIQRGTEDITISIEYVETVDFPGGYSKDLAFSIHVEEPLKESSGALK